MLGDPQINQWDPPGLIPPPPGAPMRFWVDDPELGRLYVFVHAAATFTWIIILGH
jgi:hypothetical protein